ncbi:hypothetical protein [Amycolatopsis anabasis]|uniref:hypothetical protein n=1 Tax=Amycolatopsis anabasis TaxID=1840409 RepID=UPI001C554B99|nr:hypothetical protein [Amycolatopsis anabasis]
MATAVPSARGRASRSAAGPFAQLSPLAARVRRASGNPVRRRPAARPKGGRPASARDRDRRPGAPGGAGRSPWPWSRCW